MNTKFNSPIDDQPLKRMFGDDPDLFKEILNDFLVQTLKIIEELKSGWKNRSADEIEMAAHKLKSSARSVGAFILGDICATLESAGGDKNWDIIDKQISLLESEMDKVECYIKNL